MREHLDVLTNWYVRTQRDRFWAEDADAFDTLWTALEVLTRVMAPLAPLVTEEVWRGLTGGRSVHLTDWPERGTWHARRRSAGAAMDQVRAVVSTALGLRKAAGVRVRQPLHTLTVAVDDADALAPYRDLLAAELNVKRVDLVTADAGTAERFGITQRLAVNARAAGPRLGRGVQAVIKAARAEAWRVDGDTVVVTTDDGDVALEPAEYELTTVVGSEGGAAAVLPGGGFVVLDLTLDDALRAEGYARDVVRVVQDARKAAGLQVGDRILLTLDVPSEHVAAVEQHRDTIARETLALSVEIETGAGAAGVRGSRRRRRVRGMSPHEHGGSERTCARRPRRRPGRPPTRCTAGSWRAPPSTRSTRRSTGRSPSWSCWATRRRPTGWCTSRAPTARRRRHAWSSGWSASTACAPAGSPARTCRA